MNTSEIAENLKNLGQYYNGRAEDADTASRLAASAGKAALAEQARAEVGLLKACSDVCQQGRYPVVVCSSAPMPPLPATFAEVSRAATTAGLIQHVRPDST